MKRTVIIVVTIVLVIGAIASISRRSSGRIALGKVSGTVTYNGKPVEEAVIVFHNSNGRSATGKIQAGTIQDVTTYDKIGDGAAVGKLAVTIHPGAIQVQSGTRFSTDGSAEKSTTPQVKVSLPAQYRDLEARMLSAEIHPGSNVVSFDLKD